MGGAGADILYSEPKKNLEPEPRINGSAPQHYKIRTRILRAKYFTWSSMHDTQLTNSAEGLVGKFTLFIQLQRLLHQLNSSCHIACRLHGQQTPA